MSKATRNRTRNARERIAAQQAAARKAEQRRRMLIVGGSVGLVLVIVVGLILYKSLAKPGKTLGSGNLPAAVAKNITNVPVSTLSAVGTGPLPSTGLPLKTISGTPLTSGGKPEMLYIGAEFCPYCAAMRWSMAIALGRFGTLSPLHAIRSSPTDTDPNTATLTFYKTSYTSNYLTFTPVEVQTVSRAPLQNPTSAQNAIWAKYEPDPNTRGYPFISFGNKLLLKTPIYDPGVLAGKTWSQIAAALKDSSSPIAQGVDGAANYVTGAICKMTNNQPASVCTTPAVTAVSSGL